MATSPHSEQPDSGPLARRFARRMAPVAILVGVIVAFVPPLSYSWASWSEMTASASQTASRLAEAIQVVAARQPSLWRYNLPKVLHATAGYRTLGSLGAVRVTDCRGETLFSSEALALGTGADGGPAAWAPVIVRGREVAWVEVTMDPARAQSAAATIGAASLVLGLLTGLLLFVWPVGVVRRLSAELGGTVARLSQAEQELKAANADLYDRVQEAVSDARSLSERVISIQEGERARLARELHDGLGQLVAGLEIELQLAEQSDAPTTHIREARDLCQRTLEELRRAIRDLEPLELETAPLPEVLRGVCERFELRTGLVTPFRHTGADVDEPDLKKCLLRVLQESLNNVWRHAGAEEVGVHLEVHPGEVRLRVADDGGGFDVASTSGGLGLRSIRDRVHYLGGEVEVVSSDTGTTIDVALDRPQPLT